ncbi:C4-dicarboxylate ABC transporter substrate-binding protein [Acuticoccus sediminis]|uniref:C4-dicarboxylate ABC transporter substrate-binding protein n=1 Tax=Acuticoccus sediminis TaxID=2184697 RepID=A0A8B2NM37_9HYPH|nr:TRAP transporter substrate-binding protein DctP [Acuticoccus sediminis]RAH98874.1 C4-dicarboxylate ABC transporter substrate-binding protein [Acuticoccus sediminis]
MTNINRRTLVKLAGGAAVMAAAGPLAAPAIAQGQKVKWRMQALWDGGTTPLQFEEDFVTLVGEKTGGDFEIQLFSAGQIVPPAQAFDAVRGGAFQMMKTFDGYEAGKIPALAFTSTIPFGFPEAAQYNSWFYDHGGIEMAKEAYAPAGLSYIAPSVYGQEPIHSKVRITEISQFAGKNGRFVGLASAVMSGFGVKVSPLPTSEVYSALDKGLIDIADRGDLQANLDAGLGEVAKFIILPGVHQPTTSTSYVANAAALKQLPDGFADALAEAAKETAESYEQNKVKTDESALAAFKEQGVEVLELSNEDVVASRPKAKELWEQATKGNALAKKILDSQVALMEEMGLLG